MGKHSGRGGGRGRGRGRDWSGRRGRNSGGNAPRWAPRAEVRRANEKFESYYNDLDILPEDERAAMWEVMRSDLPNSFRFTGSKGHALTVQQSLIDRYIPEIVSVKYEGEPVAPPTPVQWYPDQLAWSMTTPKNVIRKFPPFASFQKFLVSENGVGNITRQEIVSMIPPLLMDVKPGMTVLDLCAAPGSKSTQLVELIHGGEEARVRKVQEELAQKHGLELGPEGKEIHAEKEQAAKEDDWSDDGRATGLLIANDVEYRRAQMLVHQCKRLNSPNLVVMNHDATLFPSIKMPPRPGQTSYLKFDRILADVPCSGDGTCRKNVNVWKDWNPGNGLGLHPTQVRILVRALQMLKVGGRVAYSTCSMNPIENEAVVAAAIDRCGGSEKVKIIDKSDALPGLHRKPGMTTWEVMDKVGRWWTTWNEVERTREEGGDETLSKLSEGLFPPKAENEIHLERCIRVYPHLQDTGAFFITVLEKQTEIKARPENEPKKPMTQPTSLTTVTSIVDEIEQRDKDGGSDMEKIETLDKFAPPQNGSTATADEGRLPPVARQNSMDSSPAEVSSLKRSLDNQADAEAPMKKMRTREDLDAPAPEGFEDRKVHWPPPPGAELSLTEHDHKSNEPIMASSKATNLAHEEAFKYLDPDHEALQEIYAFYHLSPRFPRDRFLVRNATGEPVKAIYYTSGHPKDILTENEGKGIKFVHSGVKMFVKQDTHNQPGACKWRIQSEGLPIIEHWVGEERIVRLTHRQTLRKLLVEMFPKLSQDSWKELGDIGSRLMDLGLGCCVLRIEPSDVEDGFQERLVLPLWRGLGSVNLMLPKEDRKAMLLRMFNEDIELVNHSKNGQGRNMANGQKDEKVVITADSQSISDIVDDEDEGGVELDKEDGIKLSATEQRSMEIEDAMKGDLQHEVDQTREVAPGITDETEEFNRTV